MGGGPQDGRRSSHERQKRAVPPCWYLPKILQGGRSRSQSTIFPVERVEPEVVFRHFKLNGAFLSFEMLFWQLGTSKELVVKLKEALEPSTLNSQEASVPSLTPRV